MIVAILIAPFLAVFAQRQIDLWREQRQRNLWVFKTLMATHGRTLSPEHVQALNMIELKFQKSSEKPILDAWKEYHDLSLRQRSNTSLREPNLIMKDTNRIARKRCSRLVPATQEGDKLVRPNKSLPPF